MDNIFDHTAPAAPEPPTMPDPPAPEAETHAAPAAETDAAQYAPPPPQKVRRVGTFAFGLVLIAAGALLLAAILVPGFDPSAVARFAPVILIVLGIEVLVYAAKPGVKLKYDFLSMFACAFILLVVGGASLLPYLWNTFGPAADARLEKLSSQLEEAAFTAIQADPALKGIISEGDCYFYRDSISTDPAAAPAQTIYDLPGGRAYFTLAPDYADAEAFAADCQRILIACEGLPIEDYQFSNIIDRSAAVPLPEFHLSTGGRWLREADLATVAANVSTEWYIGDSWFNSKAEAEEYLDRSQVADEEAANQEYNDGYHAGYSIGYNKGYNTAMNGDEYNEDPDAVPGDTEPASEVIEEVPIPREVG